MQAPFYFHVILLSLIVCSGMCYFMNVYPKVVQTPVTGDPGEPLILTPLIRAGKISEARNASRVGYLQGAGHVTSYSGFITVNESFNSNLFFWFFPAQNNYASAPVVVWLQGGPGASSLFGLFTEHGPFYVTKKYTLRPRKYSWTSSFSVIYIDNPVGTGFSFTGPVEQGYARNETAVGKDLFTFIQQFFQLFPELQKNEFYITGESYAGKYVPAFGYAIHKNNPKSSLKINLKGLAIGNGLCDPEHMFQYGDYLYQLGLIDLNGRYLFHKGEDKIRQYIKDKQWDKAFDMFDMLLNSDVYLNGSLFYNLTGIHDYFNYLRVYDFSRYGDSNIYVQKEKVRRAIHVGNRVYSNGSYVEQMLKEDVMQSVAPWVAELLNHYRILVYNGQLDIIVAYPLTESYLQALNWTGAAAYKTAPRHIWKVDNAIAGYAKHAGNLTEVLVRDAGHMVPSDQPKWAYDLIHRFIFGKGFH